MPKGLSLHVGVADVSWFRYGNRLRRLNGPLYDAGALAGVAAEGGFSAATLSNNDATGERLRAALSEAARRLATGDSFLLTYSGHGLAGRTREGFQQSWCLFDAPFFRFGEEGLDAMLSAFVPGVRVTVLANCCHSGVDDGAWVTPPIHAEVIRLSACRANEVTFDSRGPSPSPFIRQVLAASRADGGFDGFFARLGTGVIERSANCSAGFLAAGPFRL